MKANYQISRLSLLVASVVLIAAVIFLSVLWTWLHGPAKRRECQMALLRVSGAPTNAMDWELAHLRPLKNDSTGLWLDALLSLKRMDSISTSLPIVGHRDQTPPPPDQEWDRLEEAETYLAQFGDELRRLHKAAKSNGDVRFVSDFSAGQATSSEHVSGLASAGQLLELAAHVHTRRNNVEATVACVTTMIRAGESVRYEPTMLSRLVRHSLRERALRVTAALTPHLDLNATHWQELSKLFQGTDYWLDFRRCIEGERALTITTVSANAVDLEATRRQVDEELALYLQSMQALIDVIELPAEKALVVADDIERNIDETAVRYFLKTPHFNSAMLLYGNSRAIVQTVYELQSIDRLATSMIAINRYRQQHDHWPKTIDELVPSLLPQPLKDPYVNSPLRYKVTQHGYVLYSVGSDLTDNGGAIEDYQDFGIRVQVDKSQ